MTYLIDDLVKFPQRKLNVNRGELEVMFIEASAKAGHNVKSLFKKIAQALPEWIALLRLMPLNRCLSLSDYK
ncbi:hypothetical protein Pst134EA_031631 [Puccinia striiformis f. sp. tritici]|uniref:uncharacterized protein n=1 Tax=Puccinia striiformis f. sp. tritici TaxID=168172 RepID=UPI0020086D0E|nr:uncharacterized protein Pst134EA_031631 [Puccinia striiformis f. sp. tritici]KAH9442719.1 hypothetical protein Pst134EA_031631 [Puccinia striiformis f. sp. tritici]